LSTPFKGHTLPTMQLPPSPQPISAVQERFFQAMREFRSDEAREQLRAGANPSLPIPPLSQFDIPRRALQVAMGREDSELAGEIIAHTAAPGREFHEALVWAAQRGYVPVLDALRARGADLQGRGNEAVRAAATEGQTEVLEWLHAHGGDIRECSDAPLLQAAAQGHFPATCALLRLGAEATSLNGGNAYAKARNRGHIFIAGSLLAAGAQVGQPDYDFMRNAGTSRNHEAMTCFLSLALKIIKPRTNIAFREEFFRAFCVELGVAPDVVSQIPLQGAYDKRLPWHAQPVVRIALGAAMVAASIAPGMEEMERVSGQLFTADLTRVASTPGLSWQTYSTLVLRSLEPVADARDLFAEVANVVALPMLAAEAPRGTPIEELCRRSLCLARDLILEGKSTLDISAFVSRWHRPGSEIPPALVPFRSTLKGEWLPLFAPTTLPSGHTVQCLTTTAMLKEAGRVLKNCIGRDRYQVDCEMGSAQVVTIRRPDGRIIAAIELQTVTKAAPGRALVRLADTTEFEVVQFRGEKNRLPTLESSAAWKSFTDLLRQGRVTCATSWEAFRDRDKERNAISHLDSMIGYPLEEAATYLPKILAFYRDSLYLVRNNGTRVPLLSSRFSPFCDEKHSG